VKRTICSAGGTDSSEHERCERLPLVPSQLETVVIAQDLPGSAATEARLFDSYTGRHAHRRTQRKRQFFCGFVKNEGTRTWLGAVNNTQQTNRSTDDAGDELGGRGQRDELSAHGDELTSEERDLFTLLNLPVNFGGGSREGSLQGAHQHTVRQQQTFARLVGSNVGDDDFYFDEITNRVGNESSLSQDSQCADAHLMPGFFLWHQAYDREYLQYYYYRQCTQETQWEPPAQGFVPVSYEDVHLQEASHSESFVDEFYSNSIQRLTVSHPKYWSQRYRFFSLFDNDVRLDTEAWFSVTPERIANHQAQRCYRRLLGSHRSKDISETISPDIKCTREDFVTNRCGQLVILDAFCGVGGNTIAFARCAGVYVIACDNDKTRLDLAARNTTIYGVHNTVDFLHDDVVVALTTASRANVTASEFYQQTQNSSLVDMIFLSPPWGGPEYMNVDTYDLHNALVSGLDLIALLKLALTITPNVACFLPRNTDMRPFVSEIVLEKGNRESTVPFEIENNCLNGKLKAITIYFGNLALVK